MALADYKPFWRIDAIPQTDAVRFILADKDDAVENAMHGEAAARQRARAAE